MKLVKLFNKLSAVALAASLVVGFASCSTTTDDPFNPNAPLTLEEYVKSEIKKAIENGGAQAKPEDPSELEFESRTSLMDKIQLNNEKTEDAWGNGTKISSANPLQASEGYGWDKENGQISLPFAYDAGYFGENTHIIIEADDSALNYNADAAIKIEFKVENPSTGHSNEMNITSKFKDGVAIIPISEIGFTDSCQFLLTFRAKGTVTIKNIDMAEAKGQSAPEPTPGEEQKPGEEETPEPGEKPEPGEESARPAIGDVVYSATGDSLTVVLPQNIYGEPAISHGIQVTKVGILPKGAKAGETYKIVLKGTASGAFSANVQFLNKGWQGLGDEATVANFTTEDFNITAYYTFGFDTEDGYMFVIGNDDAECTEKTLTLTEFSITRENKPAGGENNAGGEGDNGEGESTSKTYGLCKKYTVTTTKDIAAGDFAFVLQIENDGEKSEDGLKIDVTDFEMEVKVGEEEPFTFTRDKIAMIPNQWSSPAYGVTDCRFKLDGEKDIPFGTKITVQVKKATVSNKAKADSIIYVFNEDGVGGYDQYVSAEDNYKHIFAPAEI